MNIRPLVACMLVALVAGCTTPSSEDAPTSTTSAGITTSPAPIGPPTLTIAALLPTSDASITVTGTVAPPLPVRIEAERNDGKRESYSTNGEAAWSISIPLSDFGHTNLTVQAGDASSLATQNVIAIRLATATMKARFNNYPGHTDYDNAITYDPDRRASASMYDGKSLAHPDFATVHDAMIEWAEQSGPEIVYTYSDGSVKGYTVSTMDGAGTPVENGALGGVWCYKQNTKSDVLGLSIQPILPGDVIDWGLGCFI